MAKFEYSGLDELSELFENPENIPLDFDCVACGQQFEVTLKELHQPPVKCPHCGVEFEVS